MSAKKRRARSGPVEAVAWPSRLTGSVVDEEGVRIHGYAAAADLARHYTFAEVCLLSLTGQAPEGGVGRLFERALVVLAPVPVGDAPAHAALLARICGARPSSITGVAGLVAAQGAEGFAEIAVAVRAWGGRGALPPALRGGRARDRAARATLREVASAGVLDVPVLSRACSLEAAVAGALLACGVTAPWQIAAALTVARLPCAVAEACAEGAADMRTYPMRLPDYAYVEDR